MDVMAELDALRAELRDIQQNNSTTTPAPVVSSIYKAPKIPLFCKENVSVWFLQVDITFRNAGITASTTKADFVAEKLDYEALQAISDIITLEPRPADVYDRIKRRLTDMYDMSAEAKLRTLIKGNIALGGKPSLILNRLRALNTGAGDNVIRSIFLEQLPAVCRATLAVSGIQDLNVLADMASKFAEAMDSNSFNSINAVSDHSIDSESKSTLTREIFMSEMSKLTNRIEKLESQMRNVRGRSRFRSKSNANDRNNSDSNAKLCFYHNKFGDNAKKCVSPCIKYPLENSKN